MQEQEAIKQDRVPPRVCKREGVLIRNRQIWVLELLQTAHVVQNLHHALLARVVPGTGRTEARVR